MSDIDDLLDSAKVIGLTILIFVIVLGVTMIPMALANRASCSAKTAEIGFPHRWEFWGGCRIEITPGQWIPLDNYYFNQTEK